MAFKIDKTNKTPMVFIDSEKGTFLMEGLILPEDSVAFFKPILNCVSQYLQAPQPETRIVFRLEYFNTSSSRLLYTLLKQFGDSQHFTKTTVYWFYEDDDIDLEEVGDEFTDMFSTLNFIKKPFPCESNPSFKDII